MYKKKKEWQVWYIKRLIIKIKIFKNNVREKQKKPAFLNLIR